MCSRWLWKAGAEDGIYRARGTLAGQLAEAGAGTGLDIPQCVLWKHHGKPAGLVGSRCRPRYPVVCGCKDFLASWLAGTVGDMNQDGLKHTVAALQAG